MLRHALLILLLVGFALVVTRQLTDFASLIRIVATAKWQWLAAAIGLHGVYFVLYSYLYRESFSIVGVRAPIRSLLANYFAADFINAVAPLGGAGSAALFIDDATSRGQSGARAAAGVLLTLILDLVTALPFIGFGDVYLEEAGHLAVYDVAASLFFVVFIGLLIATLALAYADPKLTERVLHSISAAVNHIGRRFRRSALIEDAWATENSAQFSHAARAAASVPGRLLYAIAIGLLLHVVSLLVLYTLSLAFVQTSPSAVIVAGFGLSIVYPVISLLKGVGVVEYVMTLVFTSAGMLWPDALAIVLSYRGLSYWLPLLIGLVFVSRAPTFWGRSRARAEREVELR